MALSSRLVCSVAATHHRNPLVSPPNTEFLLFSFFTQTGENIIFAGRNDNQHQSGVAIMMSKEAFRALESWNPVSDRIITARFYSKHIKTTIIQVYAPTNDADTDEKDRFYELLQQVYDRTPRHVILITMGDWNAKLGHQMEGENGVVGKHGLGSDRSDNGERFIEFCAANNMAITTTMFPHKDIHKYTWTSPDGRTRNQIDHIAVNGIFKRSVQDTRAFRGADVGSDHNLVVGNIRLKLSGVVRKQGETTARKYELSKLKVPEIKQRFVLELKNRFSCLAETESDETGNDDTQSAESVEEKWSNIKKAFSDTAKSVLGHRQRKGKTWISATSWSNIDERRKLKKKMEETRSERIRERRRIEYNEKSKEVKRSLRADKREWANALAREAEEAARNGNLKEVYEVTKTLCRDRPRRMNMVKDQDGKLLTTEEEIRHRWQEHFNNVLNRPEPVAPAVVYDRQPNEIDVSDECITRQEIKQALKNMKNGKAAGMDSITTELLKADIETTACVLEDLFRAVWESEEIPEDWNCGLIVKLPKKGNLTDCGNWRGITLLSVPAKVMGRVIITRLYDAVDGLLREEQAGFRSGRNTVEHIFVLRNIIEQSLEWNASLYTCFVDYEKAFDSVHRETLWRIMHSYGIPSKFIRMVKLFYSNTKCAVIDGAGKSEWFTVKAGVKQGCVMSGFLFLLVIDWIMCRTTEQGNTGIRWKMMRQLEDLDYADDIALISSTWAQAQTKLERLGSNSEGTGLKININKTKMLRLNTRRQDPIKINGTDVEDTDSFVYLGAIVNNLGGAEQDIRSRLGKARSVFHRLSKVWRTGEFRRETKLRIFKSNIIAVLLYGCETWRMTKTDEKRLDTFLHKCLRKILTVHWPMRVSNDEIRRRAGIEKISLQVRRRRWKWIGHVLRMAPNRNPYVALSWAPSGKRSRGRPRETWRRTVEKERAELGLKSWAAAAAVAKNRDRWRALTSGPIPHLGARN